MHRNKKVECRWSTESQDDPADENSGGGTDMRRGLAYPCWELVFLFQKDGK